MIYERLSCCQLCICESLKLFKHGQKSLDDDLGPGRPIVATSDIIKKNTILMFEDAKIRKQQLKASLEVL